VFSAEKMRFESESVVFDPLSNRLTAIGSINFPATLYDDSGASQGSFVELTFDTRTQQVIRMKDFRATVRR
jgi:hypothetical protein